MDARLDPECDEARALDERHAHQTTLLVGQNASQLRDVVRRTQEQQVRDHLVRCARCRHYDPACPSCGFDARRERHGWRCPKARAGWSEWLPWNWRARRAPARPRGAPGVGADGTRTIPVRDAPPPQQAPRPAPSRPGSAAARTRAKPPATRGPATSPLVAAYATLGLTSAASPEQVRAAFREKAKEYHPDRVATLAPEFREVAERKMKEINEAYARIRGSWPRTAP